jgi:hypothetical protein
MAVDTSAALIVKIRKLLAKAEGTDNANEAETFSSKAAQLIAEHRIDPEHVRRMVAADELGLRRIPIGRGAYVRARLALLTAVANSYECEVVFEAGAAGTTATVAGYESDLAVTDVLYTSLHTQAASQRAAVRRRTPAATQRWRRSFLFGFATHVADLLAAARVEAAATHGPGDRERRSGDTLPDVQARAQRVRQFAAQSFGRVVAARPPAPAQVTGWRDGHRAAGAADLGRSHIADRKALNRGGR